MGLEQTCSKSEGGGQKGLKLYREAAASKREENSQIVLKPFGESSFYTILKKLPTEYLFITKGSKKLPWRN